MAKKKVIAVTMTQEQWNQLTQTVANIQSMQTEVIELQDALVELASIVAGGEE